MTLYPDYVTVSGLHAYLRIPQDDTSEDALLGTVITAASRAVDNATHRQFGKSTSTEARLYTAEWDRERAAYTLSIDDLMTANGLVIMADFAANGTYATAISSSNFLKYPLNASGSNRPWTRLVARTGTTLPTLEAAVEVTAQWGWTAVPATIEAATLLQAARLFKRRDAPFGVAGSPEMGSELRLLPKLDPDVELMVQPYKRLWGAA